MQHSNSMQNDNSANTNDVVVFVTCSFTAIHDAVLSFTLSPNTGPSVNIVKISVTIV
jgi:hypothetical protein